MESRFTLNDYGLYVHVPFCRKICAYCDFVKTSRHYHDKGELFFEKLVEHSKAFLAIQRSDGGAHLSTVFFGGGTPSLFDREYIKFFRDVEAYLGSASEVSLEANIDDITAERLTIWSDVGFNRCSLGVQTFDPDGLRFLTRDHSSGQAMKAIESSLRYFPNLNIDLIFGWKNQSIDSWLLDLQTAVSLGVPHVSLYNLTFEERTPLGRKAAKGAG